jgi:hypothetical protein
VVTAAHSYAATLADLTDRGIGHRDIKPGNLFRYQERWVLGDFGLAVYPGKEAITAPGRRLGPLFFMAPEMLREPDVADAGPADVFSLAKTLWVLASGQRYPPEGQIRTDLPEHDLGSFTESPGTLALGLILEGGTAIDPAGRPTMAEFERDLRGWLEGGPHQDEVAARTIRARQVDRLGDELGRTLEARDFDAAEQRLREKLPEARRQAEEKRQKLRAEGFQEAENRRRDLSRSGDVKTLLSVLDSPWVGSLGDGEAFAAAILTHPEEERGRELEKARRILLGRPLWWLHTVVLAGCLRLRGQPGCEPSASDIAREEAIGHLLEFPEHPTGAAAWRLQRALIPATARVAGFVPIQVLEERARSMFPTEMRIRFGIDSSRIFTLAVQGSVRSRLLGVAPWSVGVLDREAEEAEEALDRLPIPGSRWLGPVTDPWLQSWREMSPLLLCGLTALVGDPGADDLLRREDVGKVILDTAKGDFEILRRPAVPLARRLGLLESGTGSDP